MKLKHSMMHLSLAGIGLVAAYVTYTRPKESVKAESVTVLNATKTSLERVYFEDGNRFFDLKKSEPRPLLTLGFVPGKEPKDEPTLNQLDGGIPPEKPRVIPTRTTYSNERGEAVMAKLAPFEAQRALGKLDEHKLDELGLIAGVRTLAIAVAGAERKFKVSKPQAGVFGSYIQDENSKEVFLVSASLFSDVDPNSQMLVERRIHQFKQNEFDSFSVKIEKQQADFVQTNADIPQSAMVARAKTPEKPDELAKNWHDKMFNRLIVTEVLGKGELPKAGVPNLKMRLEYSLKGKPVGFLEVFQDDQGLSWIRTENTLSYVGVHQGSEELVVEAQRFMAQ
jgi:hypothetical protein